MSFCRLKFESQKKAKIINESYFHLAMAQRRQRAADHLFPCRLPPPSCFSKRWCFFHNCPQCSGSLNVAPLLPINHIRVSSGHVCKIEFFEVPYMVTFETLLLIAICVKDRHCHGNLQPLNWINFFVTITKLAPHSFWGFHTYVQPKTESLSMPIVAKVWITLTCPPGWLKKLSSSVAICVDAASLGLKYL